MYPALSQASLCRESPCVRQRVHSMRAGCSPVPSAQGGLIGVGGVFLVEEQPHRWSQQLGQVSSRPPQGGCEACLADSMGLETVQKFKKQKTKKNPNRSGLSTHLGTCVHAYTQTPETDYAHMYVHTYLLIRSTSYMQGIHT